MSFDPKNHSLKIWDFIRTPIPKVGSTWGCVGSFLHTLLHSGNVNVTPRLHSQPTPLHALALVASSRLRL